MSVPVPLREWIASPRIESWLDDITRLDGASHRDVAGSFAAIWMIDAIALPVTRAAIDSGRTWRLDIDEISVRQVAAGRWIEPVAGSDIRIPSSRAELVDQLTADLAAVFGNIFSAIRRHVPYGVIGMWGAFADDIATCAVSDARRRGDNTEGAWHAAMEIIDAVARRVPALRGRPTRQLVTWAGGREYLVVRSTCCLLYKAAGGDSWCTSCPLRPAERRSELFATALERERDS